MRKLFFGEKLYFVHDILKTIVEGHPIVAFNPDIPYQDKKVKTKFGTIWGQWAQFGLFNISGTIPSLQVCVYWDCHNCYSTHEEARKHLKKILSEDIKSLQQKQKELAQEIKYREREFLELNSQIQKIQDRKQML